MIQHFSAEENVPELGLEDLLQRPYGYQSPAFAIHPALASQVASIRCRQEYPCYHYETILLEPPADYEAGLRETGQNLGSGSSFTDPAEALGKSLFEAWERKTSKVFDVTQLVAGSYRQLAERAANPEDFSLISDWEYRQSPLAYLRYTPDLQLSWSECYRIHDRTMEPVLLPATLVYSRFSWKHPRQRFVPNLSVGLACHQRYSQAFLAGLCELIERDAFLLTWLHRRCPTRIRPESVPLDQAQTAFEFLRAVGFGVHFLDLTTDLGIPVILSILEHPRLPWHGTFVPGLGCHLDPAAALRKSFLEALTLLNNYLTFDPVRGQIELVPRTLPYGLQTEPYYRSARFLLSAPEAVDIASLPDADHGDPGRNLLFLLDRLQQRGYTSYFVDLTPPAYRDCRLCLTRAFIAGLQPMLYEPDCWRLNPERLFGQGRPPGFDRLNLLPHPFMLME